VDATGREFIEYAVDGSKRLREMLSGLLEYSRNTIKEKKKTKRFE
jgi:hypothetical protein